MDGSDSSNTDTSFKVQLGREIRTKRIVMASCVAENFWCQFQDLSLSVNGTLYTIIPDVYLTQTTFISYLNSKVGGNIFSYGNTLPVWDTRLELNGTGAFTLIGQSWYDNLGFTLNVTSNSQIA